MKAKSCSSVVIGPVVEQCYSSAEDHRELLAHFIVGGGEFGRKQCVLRHSMFHSYSSNYLQKARRQMPPTMHL